MCNLTYFSGAPKSCLQGPEEAREFWFEEYKEFLPWCWWWEYNWSLVNYWYTLYEIEPHLKKKLKKNFWLSMLIKNILYTWNAGTPYLEMQEIKLMIMMNSGKRNYKKDNP